MMTHLALCSHKRPENVLIVGGGDGGILREVCRDPLVKHITLVEIDEMVIEVAKQYLQEIVPSYIFDDPRLEIVHADGAAFMQELAQATVTSTVDDEEDNFDSSDTLEQELRRGNSNGPNRRRTKRRRYDVILADTLDPLGPAESLFEPEFYEAMHTVLRDDGIICTQGECFWIHLELIRDLLVCCTDIFDYAEYASTMVPSAPCGQIGFILARKAGNHHLHRGSFVARSFKMPERAPTFQSDLRWYNPQLHQSSFVLPEYIQREIGHLYRHDQMNDGGNEDPTRCFLSECAIL